MSRANLVLLKAQQREDESIRLRKHIIKSNSFAITNTNNATNLFDYITESDNKYVDRIKSLQSFKTKSKEKTKVTTTTTTTTTAATTAIAIATTTTTTTTTIINIIIN